MLKPPQNLQNLTVEDWLTKNIHLCFADCTDLQVL